MSLPSLVFLASWPQDIPSASLEDDILLPGQVSAQPSHTNPDRTSTNDPVTDLVYPVLNLVHSVRSWDLPEEISSKCKAHMDIDVNQSQFCLFSIESAQCAVVLGPFKSADLYYLG